jgi:hypothetical protein
VYFLPSPTHSGPHYSLCSKILCYFLTSMPFHVFFSLLDCCSHTLWLTNSYLSIKPISSIIPSVKFFLTLKTQQFLYLHFHHSLFMLLSQQLASLVLIIFYVIFTSLRETQRLCQDVRSWKAHEMFISSDGVLALLKSRAGELKEV